MKEKLQAIRMLLVVAMLCLGVNVTWAETVGSTSDAELASKSTSITLADGESVNYVFSQTTSKSRNDNGFELVVENGSGTKLVQLRQCNWEVISYSSEGITNNFTDETWTNFKTLMDGATVNMTVEYSEGTLTMNSTITASDGTDYTYNYTKAIDGTPESVVVYLSEWAAKLSIGKVVITRGTVTDTTYDFQSMGSATLTASGTTPGNERSNKAYVPNELSSFLGGRFAIYFVTSQTTTVDATNGLKHVNSGNSGRAIGILMTGVLAGDKILVQDNMRAGGPSNTSNCNMTIDGVTEPSQGTTLTAGSTYYAKATGTAYMQLLHNKTIKSINIISNSSANYAALFSQWRTAATYYANDGYTEGRSTFNSAITSAKAVMDDVDATEEELSTAFTSLREASEYFYAINTKNTTYSVTESSTVGRGVNVKSVYGITMTYGGGMSDTWSFEEPKDSKNNSRGKRFHTGTRATVENKVPVAGTFFTFTPTIAGILTFKLLGWAGNSSATRIKADLSDGTTVKEEVLSNAYTVWDVDFGVLTPGKTYYFYCAQANGNEDPGISGFTYEPTVSKTISAAGWATYCSPYALDLENATGLTDAYIVTGGTGSKLTKTSVKGGTVPANTGLLLKGDGTATIPVVASSATDVSANKLKGVTAETTLDLDDNDDGTPDKSVYVLMNDATNGLGFYRTSTTSFTLGANTAYLSSDFDAETPGPGARMSFLLDEVETTGIKTVQASGLKATGYYDLQGRRVSQPTKGLYIVNGRKVVVK